MIGSPAPFVVVNPPTSSFPTVSRLVLNVVASNKRSYRLTGGSEYMYRCNEKPGNGMRKYSSKLTTKPGRGSEKMSRGNKKPDDRPTRGSEKPTDKLCRGSEKMSRYNEKPSDW